MLKDIETRRVEDIVLAVMPKEEDADFWDVYFINLKEEPIRGVLINSKGYGMIDGEKRDTSVLRHFFEEVAPLSAVLIEPIDTKIFDLTHEYWVCFSLDDYLYDKRYVFVQGSLHADHFMPVPFMEGRKGVMIR